MMIRNTSLLPKRSSIIFTQGEMSSKYSTTFCTNCGNQGHITKQCTFPVTSYGVIMFRINGAWNQAEMLLKAGSLNGLDAVRNQTEFLLIQRRDSLGFVDMMRGKYRANDYEYIKQQIRGTTRDEQARLLNVSFDTLWEQLWGPPQEGTHAYKNEKESSRVKLEQLRTGSPSLAELIEEVNTVWPTPEWGFPKGRRDNHESEFNCAMREMFEETGICEKDVIPVKNMEPISETFFGSNSVQYCHKYWIVYMASNKDITMKDDNEHMRREVGDIGWFSL